MYLNYKQLKKECYSRRRLTVTLDVFKYKTFYFSKINVKGLTVTLDVFKFTIFVICVALSC